MWTLPNCTIAFSQIYYNNFFKFRTFNASQMKNSCYTVLVNRFFIGGIRNERSSKNYFSWRRSSWF
ncbi:predicted protein [Listeria monocytogenes FSL R2-503]|nr:predicted protein [Listeria monocytogenes FSL R2-503]